MTAAARVGFTVGLERFEETVPVPDGPARPRDLVPTAQALAEAIVGRAVADTAQRGEAISCRKGCGACCRQVVPVSQPEARHLAELIDALPMPRRVEVEARFAEAHAKLESSGLGQRLRDAAGLDDAGRQQLAVDYFGLGIACPFLEDEVCSIYEHRPLVCREYLVITPAQNCAQPTVEPVTRIKLSGRVSLALGQLEDTTAERSVWWLPLTSAPAWATRHPDESERRPPLDLLRELLNWLKRTG